MTVEDFEERVWEIDHVRIVVRAGARVNIGDYDWQNSADQNQRVTSWLDTRITPRVQGNEVIVLDGTGEEVHGKTLLRTVREGYGR
jgi:hypothetical protein